MRRYPWGLLNLVLEDRKDPVLPGLRGDLCPRCGADERTGCYCALDPTPLDNPRARNLKVYGFRCGAGHDFDVVALDFSEAFEQARAALGGRCPIFRGISASLPGVKAHTLRLRRRSS